MRINYIRLLQIQQLVTSPTVTVKTQIILSTLIVRHNSNFLELYPNESFLPKMHYLVHLSTQMREFGPLQNRWCLRMESKNGFFKKRKLRNTKTVAKSLSMYHQQWMCEQLNDSTAFLNRPLETKSGSYVQISSLTCYNILPDRLRQCGKERLLSTDVTINGVNYVKNCFVIENVTDSQVWFLNLCEIYVCDNEVFATGKQCVIKYYDAHFNAYDITVTDTIYPKKHLFLGLYWLFPLIKETVFTDYFQCICLMLRL